jgi:UDP-N-acetylmuramoylalanine--D-glutamate ligase
MRVADLGSRRVAIWGLGREGRAAIGFLRKHHPGLPLVLLDDTVEARVPAEYGGNIRYVFGGDRIAAALHDIDVVVKSPGVSLYRDDIRSARERGVQITSLLNLWFAEEPEITTITVTGTKGKSTTASLIAHILTRLDRTVALAGNIGVPVTEISKADYAVIEVSSYQAADFEGVCDLGVLTSLYPEHADWHLTVERYIRDKVNLLIRSRCRIVNGAANGAVDPIFAGSPGRKYLFNEESGIHSEDTEIFDAGSDRNCAQSLSRQGAQQVQSMCSTRGGKNAQYRSRHRARRDRRLSRLAAPTTRARREWPHPVRRRQHFYHPGIDPGGAVCLCRSRHHRDRWRL